MKEAEKNLDMELGLDTREPLPEEPDENGKYYVKFRKPYRFNDQEYTGIDLSGLEDLTARDMIATQRKMEREGNISVMPEMSLEYACIFAAKATGLPVEFFQWLPPKDAARVKNRVTNFIYSED